MVNLYKGVGGWGYHLIVFVFHVLLYLFSHILSPFFRWLEYDGCCVSFFVFSLFSLSLVSGFYCREIVVPVV